MWRQWESNPPHGDCKSSSPSLGTFAPIFFIERVVGIEPSSLDWKSNIISHYTTPANLNLL